MKTILCIGDSNTFGYDPRSYLGSRYPAEIRWTGRLDELDEWNVINRGMNGMTVLRANSYFASMIKRGAFDLAVIMLGTNDLVGGTSAEETAERMDAFLDFVQNAGKPVLLISPPHLQYGDWVLDGEQIEESLELGELYRELADKYGFSFADAGEWDIDIAYDGVHFSPEGHAAFAEKLKEVLAHMFADQRS